MTSPRCWASVSRACSRSRHAAALRYLRNAWEDVLVAPEMRAVIIRAAAVHRTDAAFDWLISIIEEGAPRQSEVAVDALAVYERNTRLHERVQAALANRKSRPRQ